MIDTRFPVITGIIHTGIVALIPAPFFENRLIAMLCGGLAETFCRPLRRQVQQQHVLLGDQRCAPLELMSLAQFVSEPHFPGLHTPSGGALRRKNGDPLWLLQQCRWSDPEETPGVLHLRCLTQHQILQQAACSTFITHTAMALNTQ